MYSLSDLPHPGNESTLRPYAPGTPVTKAAQFMSAGRPVLSDLLNSNVALSADLAACLETEFDYPCMGLTEMQARYEAAQVMRQDALP
jgi:plasmid maintenance system antidote protein VapI